MTIDKRTSAGLLLATVLALASVAAAQCPAGAEGCTELLGKGSRGSYFRVVIPSDWDGDLFLVNHGFDLDKLDIAPHHTCKGAPTVACTSNADCTGIGTGSCFSIGMLGLEGLAATGKAVGASTYSQTGWSVFATRYDLKDIIKAVAKKVGKPKRVIVTGFSMGGAVTADATMRLKAGKTIHGAIPFCACGAGGNPSWDAATDIRLVYDYLCDDVPGASFSSLPDVGDGTLAQVELGLRINTCFGVVSPSPDPAEAAAQLARKNQFISSTQFTGNDFGIIIDMGFAILGMGDFVNDPERLHGRRHGWNEGLDYSVLPGSAAGAFNAAVPRFGPGPGRSKLGQNTFIDFRRGAAKSVNYPILSYAGSSDFVCIPEFQKLYSDAAALGGKDLVQTWGSQPGHCTFTMQEIRAVIDEYLEWLDTFGTIDEDRPTQADVLARCLSYPGASAATCNFALGFTPPALKDRVPARADWPPAGRNPLP